MSFSERFRRLPSGDGWLPEDHERDGEAPRVISLPAMGPPSPDAVEVTTTVDADADADVDALVAPLVAGPDDAAPWRTRAAAARPYDADADRVFDAELETDADIDTVPETDAVGEVERAAEVELGSPVPDALTTAWDLAPLTPPGEMQSESLLASLAAALDAPDASTVEPIEADGVDVAAPEPAPAADLAPVALPLAAPPFARSKYGAMRLDGTAPIAEVRRAEPVAATRGAPSLVPPVAPSDAPRATAYALGEKSSTEAPVDPLASLKKRVEDALLRRIGSKLAEGEVSEEELHTFVERELGAVLAAEQTALSKSEQEQIVARLTDDLLGHGPMEQFLQDESVTEVMVSGLEPMYIERDGRILLTDVRFASEGQLRQVIERIVGRVGRRIDESSPMVDARLPDGSRVNAVIPPLAVDGPALTIRKFARRGLSVDDLVRSGSLSQNAADMLEACVRGRLNILVTGGTGSGKTTMLNVLSSFIPADQRIVTIEDAVELRLHQHHVIRMEARPSNIEGRGEVSIRDLVRNALRMRPDRIIVGEVRSGEALDMLQAMNTGHDGSLSTLHANQPRDALARLETMVLMSGFELPVRAIREQVASAVDLIVHISRLRDGTRRVTHIVELEGMEGDIITLTDLYLFDYSAGIDDEGKFKGELKATGLRPKFAERLADLGVDVPLPAMGFNPNGEIAVPAGFGWNR